MATTRVFRSGNSQAVRLPTQFQFRGKEVEIFRRGDEVVLREKSRGMERAFELLANMAIGCRRDRTGKKRSAAIARRVVMEYRFPLEGKCYGDDTHFQIRQ